MTGEATTLRALRREQIIRAARRLVAEGGLEALTIGALEKSVDFSRGVITYHFDNKDEIVAAVLDSAIVEINTATTSKLEAADTLAAQVRVMVSATLEGFIECREAGHVLLAFWGRIPRDEWATKTNAELYASYRAFARKVLAAAEADLPEGIDLDGMATVLVALVIGIAAQTYFQPDAIDPAAAVHEGVAAVLARLRPTDSV